MNIELRQWRHFVTVAEELHFARAATRLHMTQPPLSFSIRQLEERLGCELFVRTTRSIRLTSVGENLLPHARRLLQLAESLPELARQAASGASGSLKLAFVSIADYSILPPLMHAFRQQYPGVDIALQEATSDVQCLALEQQKIDAGLLIAPLPERLRAVLQYQRILSEPLCLAVPASAPRRLRELKQFADYPLVVVPRQVAPALYDAILGCFHDHAMTPHIAQEAIQMQTIVALVSAGMGIALVPQSVSNLKRSGVRYIALSAGAPQVELGIAWRRDHEPPVLQALLQQLQQLHT